MTSDEFVAGNEDVALGRNWQLGGTQAIEAQSMRQQASGYADQVLNNCMRAKGFRKAG